MMNETSKEKESVLMAPDSFFKKQQESYPVAVSVISAYNRARSGLLLSNVPVGSKTCQ